MLRAVVSVADLPSLLLNESAKYVGKSFPKIKEAASSCTLIEIVPEEKQKPWKAGFYRATKGPLEFENQLRAL